MPIQNEVFEQIQQIMANSAALVTAVVIAVNALKAIGLPGRFMPFFSILLGIGGAYLTISHDPSLFIIIGVLVTGTEHGVFALNQSYFKKQELKTTETLIQHSDSSIEDQTEPTPAFPEVVDPNRKLPEPEDEI